MRSPADPAATSVPSAAPMPPIRRLGGEDLPGLLAVQRACYGEGFLESADVFARRLASPVNCSLVAGAPGSVQAYLAAYRTVRGKVTALHGDFETPDGPPDTLYLHDMAVLPECAGCGLARALLETLWHEARVAGLRHTALVSVQGSRAYWERQGYAAREPASAEAHERVAGYGAQAVYMERLL
ncbi:GNAT family N-acetyltransferase [Paracidovorax citrulli]|nr:GNAT family N-acetyltransferase [Paracidovorax citrulli]UMT85682.1 GNAT family N-acetyltransferase [Paracidovorax citrulli]UMT90329.1 GNAT family N-acetyltransferase [Paracidovorax citrulli]UMT94367.1 GNAT family N-acetyltransferase [Paracidovorax citrulli]